MLRLNPKIRVIPKTPLPMPSKSYSQDSRLDSKPTCSSKHWPSKTRSLRKPQKQLTR